MRAHLAEGRELSLGIGELAPRLLQLRARVHARLFQHGRDAASLLGLGPGGAELRARLAEQRRQHGEVRLVGIRRL